MKQAKQLMSRFRIMPFVMMLLVFFISCRSGKVNGTPDLTGVRENNSVVADYINYVQSNNHLVPDHHYIQTALKKLADAVRAMSSEVRYTVTGDLEMSKQHADQITVNANESTHADHIRKAADILSIELQNLQRAKYPGLSREGDSVRSAAVAINASVLTRNQKAAIMDFFSTSSALLIRMN